MAKDKEKQSLRSIDVVGLLSLIGLSSILTAWILYSAISDQERIEAYRGAENLSREILNKGNLDTPNLTNVEERGPASTDAVVIQQGSDPWGRAYKWRWVDARAESFLVIWSSGPNGRNETDFQRFAVDDGGHLVNVDFGGDDVGYIRQMQ